ncbi:unnamed protein product [Urochloa humidicola]
MRLVRTRGGQPQPAPLASWALVVAKSEKPRGTVGYLDCASDNGDVIVTSARAKAEKPQGLKLWTAIWHCLPTQLFELW